MKHITLLVGMIVLVLITSGCICCTSGSGSTDNNANQPVNNNPPSTNSKVLMDETKQISNGYYWYLYPTLNAGNKLNIDVKTDGGAVDVMIMNSKSYGDYVNAVNSLSGGTWNSYQTETYVVEKSFTFTAPSSDTYYIVIDNTYNPDKGAYAGKDVNVHVKITV